MAPDEVFGSHGLVRIVEINRNFLARRIMGESTSNEGSATTDGNALPNRDPADVTRIKAAAAKRVQAHRARARMGLRCLTVRVSDRIVRHLITTGYLSLESRDVAASVAIALEAWIYDLGVRKPPHRSKEAKASLEELTA
jgi:hypothetical protein